MMYLARGKLPLTRCRLSPIVLPLPLAFAESSWLITIARGFTVVDFRVYRLWSRARQAAFIMVALEQQTVFLIEQQRGHQLVERLVVHASILRCQDALGGAERRKRLFNLVGLTQPFSTP